MRNIAVVCILFYSTCGFVFSQNRSDGREVKHALKTINSDFKALRKLDVNKEDIDEKLLRCSSNGFKADSCVACSLQNILFKRVCYNLTVLNEKLPYAKMNKKRLLKIIDAYNKLKTKHSG